MKTRAFLAAFAAALIGTSCAPAQQAVPAPELLTPVNVVDDVAVAVMRPVETVHRYDGRVAAYEEELLFGESRLLVSAVNCLPGGAVSAGDVLVRLDVEELVEDIEELEREITGLEEDYAFVNAINALDLKAVEAQEAQAAREYEEVETDRELDRYQKRMTELLSEKELLRLRNEQIETEQQLTLTEKRDALSKRQKEVADSVVTAPFDGVAVRIEAAPGTMAKPFEPAIILADFSRVHVSLATNDSYQHIAGTPVIGRIGGKSYTLEYYPLPTDETLAYVLEGYKVPYRFAFGPEETGLPQPGQYVSVTQTQYGDAPVLCIPVNAVYSSSEGSYVYKIEDGGAKALTYIETGRRNDSYVEIRGGIVEGDEVFVS